jgi:hypothetical protein
MVSSDPTDAFPAGFVPMVLAGQSMIGASNHVKAFGVGRLLPEKATVLQRHDFIRIAMNDEIPGEALWGIRKRLPRQLVEKRAPKSGHIAPHLSLEPAKRRRSVPSHDRPN